MCFSTQISLHAPLNSHASSLAEARQGIIFIILGLSIASMSGAIMKLLSDDLSVIQITWFRFVGFAIILLPIVIIRFGRAALKPARPGIQVIRGLSMAAGASTFVVGVQTVEFADAIAILYAYPFLLIILAVIFLGERTQVSGWLGVTGGFVGVLLVMRPEFKSLNTGTLWVFASAVIISVQLVLNRKLGALSHPFVTSLYGAISAATVLTLFLPFYWQPFNMDKIWLIGAMIICGAVSQILIVYSFVKATASTLAPFTYFEIVAAVIIGYFVFGTLPGWISWIGIALITVSGLIVARSLPGPETAPRSPKI